MITLKVTIHIFTKDDGTVDEANQWEHPSITPSVVANVYSVLSPVARASTVTTDYYDRYSSPRTHTYSITSPTLAAFTGTVDSRIRYEITNVYFYTSTSTYYSTSPNSYISYISSVDPDRLEEGLPIIYSNDSFGFQLQQFSFGNNYPAVLTSPNLYDYTFMVNHLSHELAHGFNLGHTYENSATGGGSDWQTSAFEASCNKVDYLDDVFPSPMPYCPGTGGGTVAPTATCSACYEYGDIYFEIKSNNILGGQYPNDWMSEKQMGRRYRNMHLNSVYGNHIRHYAKDMISDHTNTWDITVNETWDFDIQMYRDIVVKAGNTLTVKCKIAMAIDGKIKIEKGAKLVLDGGEITGWCKTGLWQGIEIDGTYNQDQLIYVPTGYATDQGILEVINGGTLSHAGTAVRTGTTDATGTLDWNSTGGIIKATEGNFINNIRDVEFLYYHSPGGNNVSYFTKCNFQILDDIGASAVPFSRVTLYEVYGVKFNGCNFEYAASVYPRGTRGPGIYSIDANYFIDQTCNYTGTVCASYTKTQFKDLDHGVYVDNTNPLRVVSILNTNFYDNSYNGAYFNTVNTPVFKENYVRTLGGSTSCGVYLNTCKYYNVKNNTFVEASSAYKGDPGMYVYNSQTGAHNIYHNSFSNFFVAIETLADNSGVSNTTDGLKINCNDFTQQSNLYDIAVGNYNITMGSVMRNQGAVSAQTSTNIVRNMYGADCSNTVTANSNKWWVASNSTITINHGTNSDAVTKPLPQPSCSSTLINVVASGIALSYSTDCPTNYGDGGGGGGSRLTNINQNISSLISQNNSGAKSNNSENSAFEIQVLMASKLNYFLTKDDLASKDSVIALLQNNIGDMKDADVQLTYAYMNKDDFNNAFNNANSLTGTKTDIGNFQKKLIAIQQNANKAYSLKTNLNDENFLKGYAETEDKDGRWAACALLKFATARQYTVPLIMPPNIQGKNGEVLSVDKNILMDNEYIKLYPNPTQGGITIYNSNTEEGTMQIEVKDLLGKVIYVNFINSLSRQYIQLLGINSGLYIISITKDKKLIYQSKLIKQD